MFTVCSVMKKKQKIGRVSEFGILLPKEVSLFLRYSNSLKTLFKVHQG